MRQKLASTLLAGIITLVLTCGGTSIGQDSHNHDHTCVLVTKKMCCAHESAPAIKELSKIPGVARVTADHKARSLTIIPKNNAMPSPLAIWEAAERTKLEPVRLATAHGVYTTKPKVRR